VHCFAASTAEPRNRGRILDAVFGQMSHKREVRHEKSHESLLVGVAKVFGLAGDLHYDFSLVLLREEAGQGYVEKTIEP
jgi:hypothetical protein